MTLIFPKDRRPSPAPESVSATRVALVVAPEHESSGAGRPRRAPREVAEIAAALRQEGAEVSLVDLRLPGATLEASEPADALLLFGQGTAELVTLARELGTLLSGREFVAAGPALDADILLNSSPVQAVLLDGEAPAAAQWLRRRRLGRGLAGCRGLAWRAPSGVVVREAPLSSAGRTRETPGPAWDLVALERYGDPPPLLSARSCGPRCRICHHSFGHAYRPRPLAEVCAELDALAVRGHSRVSIEDRPANLDPARLATLIRAMARRGLRPSFAAPLRADRIDEPLARALLLAGVGRIEIDVENISPRIQRETGLNLDLDRARAGIEELARVGIGTYGRFTLGRSGEGAPGPGRGEDRATLAWARSTALERASFEGGRGRHRAWLRFHLAPVRLASLLGLGRRRRRQRCLRNQPRKRPSRSSSPGSA